MAFPTSPTNGQIATVNGISYTYSSATNSWTRNTSIGSVFNITTDTFTGDGTTTQFTLSVVPASPDLVQINSNGSIEQKSAYSLNNNVLTFTTAPTNGELIEIRTTTGNNLSVITGLVFDSFTGNGVATSYTLSTTPQDKNYTMVAVGGITQAKSTYSITGATLNLTSAPANSAPIEVVTFGPATALTTVTSPHPFLFMGS